jgi:phosphoglycolate phosphatase
MPSPTVVLFDVDGTLIDSADGIARSAAAALAEFGRPPLTADQLRAFIGPPLADSFHLLDLPWDQVDGVVDAYRRHYLTDGILDYRVYPGVPDLLERLVGAGVRLGVATSKRTASARHVLEHAGLAVWFDAIAGSEPDGSRPDKAAVMAAALADLGVDDPRRAVMVGDREHDALGARTLATGFIGVTWGFGTEDELVAAGAVRTVASPAELGGMVLGPDVGPLP